MKLATVRSTLIKFYEKPLKRRILNERLCAVCAKKKWWHLEDLERQRGNGIRLDVSAGICNKCHKITMVAYIDEELPKYFKQKMKIRKGIDAH